MNRMAGSTIGSRIYLTLIGLLLAGAGGVFTWLMWRSFARANRILDWPSVPCTIIRSEIVEEYRVSPEMPPEYTFGVLYSYDWGDEAYDSEQLSLRGAGWSKSSEKAEALLRAYPAGEVTECRVNPDSPQEAVLRVESRAPGYSIWFPLIFVVGGLGTVAGAWLRKAEPKTSAEPA